jgi:LysM repeat protein
MASYNREQLPRRDIIMIIVSAVVIIGVIVGLVIFLTGRQPPKTVNPTQMAAITTSSPSPVLGTPSPSLTPTEAATAGPTPTLEPYQYTIQKNDTLGGIVQVFGYRDIGIYPEIVRLNNLPSADILPPPGSILLIPRQTPTEGPSATPTLEGATAGPTIDVHGCSPQNRCVSPDGRYWIHEVVSGDTILAIAFAYDSRRDQILLANNLCDSCPISVGQTILVPILITLTPTLTPTGGPDSTATPSPTYSAPTLLSPANGASVPRGTAAVLQWVTVHPLAANENYVIVVRNVQTGEESRFLTRANSFHLPSTLQPGLAQSTQLEWQVGVVAGSNVGAAVLSGLAEAWTFTWGP